MNSSAYQTMQSSTNANSSLQESSPVEKSITIVVPAYNEAHRIADTLRRIDEYCEPRFVNTEIIVVDDGSTDGTPHEVQATQLQASTLLLLDFPQNHGKGFALREGLQRASTKLILMTDADLSTPITELDKLLSAIKKGVDVAIGSRDVPGAVLNPPQPKMRRRLANRFRWIRAHLLLPQIKDTQCGFKLFRIEAAKAILPHLAIDGWLIDCEMLAVADRLGFRIEEIGVHWSNAPDTKVSPLAEIPRSLWDLFAIRTRVRHIERAPLSR